jgi:hypothetical protein
LIGAETKEQCEAFASLLGETYAETGADNLGENFEAIAHKVELLALQIMETPAHTVVGLRVKAIAALHKPTLGEVQARSRLGSKGLCAL